MRCHAVLCAMNWYLMEREESYVTSVILYQTTRRHITEHNNIPSHHCDRLKYHSPLSWHRHSARQSNPDHTVTHSTRWEGEIDHAQGNLWRQRQAACRCVAYFRGFQFLISGPSEMPLPFALLDTLLARGDH